jgi:PAS domain S-box-containing protein
MTMDIKDRLENLIIDNEELATVLIDAFSKPVILFKAREKTPAELMTLNKEMADELLTTHQELAMQIEENELLVAESLIVNEKNDRRIREIIAANKKIAILSADLLTTCQNIEDLKNELFIANKGKAKRAADLIVANKEKAKRIAKLIVANKEKAKRAAELVIANKEKTKLAKELIGSRKEKAKRASEIISLNKQLANQIAINNYKEDSLSFRNRISDIFLTLSDVDMFNEVLKVILEALKSPYGLLGYTDESLTNGMPASTEEGFNEYNTPDKAFIFTMETWGNSTWAQALRGKMTVFTNLPEMIPHRHIKIQRHISQPIIFHGATIGLLQVANKESDYTDTDFQILDRFSKQIAPVLDSFLKRKKLQDSIIESEEKYSSAFNSSPDMIIIMNPDDGKIIESNDAFTSISGFTREEANAATGLNLWMDTEELDLVLSSINEGKSIAGMEFLFKKKNGDSIIGLLSTKIIHINKNPYIVAFIRDITESKKTGIELRRAKEQAEESDQLKSSFLSNMSHEIRTPLNGILGFTNLLSEPDLPKDEQMDFIQTIHKSGERLLVTINNIIDIAKIESNMMESSVKATNINEKLEFICKFFQPEIKIKGLLFICKNTFAESDALIKTDSEKLYGILTNLVKNAIKFTNEGTIELGCEKKGKWLEFYVKDSGIGISREYLKVIFDRFRQGSDSLTRNYEGSGLGLSISKSYVEMMGGKMWVESEVGKGSIFYFTIPFNPVSKELKSNRKDINEKDQEFPIKNLKVLVAEDDEISNIIITRVLKNISKLILHAKTGVEAITFCKNNPDIDLVFMDIRMPQLDGYEATRQIRQFNKDLIIIAQTANAFLGDREMAINAGCNDYITKPLNKTTLYDLIIRNCSNRK